MQLRSSLFKRSVSISLSTTPVSWPYQKAAHKAAGIFFDDLDLSKQGYDPMVAYAQSKTANIYMANSIDRKYGAAGLRAVSVHPGMIFTTQLGRHMSPEELAGFAPMAAFARSAEQGAATTVWAALSPHFDTQGGVYLADAGVSSMLPRMSILLVMVTPLTPLTRRPKRSCGSSALVPSVWRKRANERVDKEVAQEQSRGCVSFQEHLV
jgi:hypothetical protein